MTQGAERQPEARPAGQPHAGGQEAEEQPWGTGVVRGKAVSGGFPWSALSS